MAITLDTQAAWYVDAKDLKCASSARQLGSGQFGEVLEGCWLACPVAVKRLYRSLFIRELLGGQSRKKQLPDVTTSFGELMTRLSAVHHPHIADFYGATTLATHPAPVLLTEQLQRSLLSRRRDATCPPLTVRDCVDSALEVASALAYLHERAVPMAHGAVAAGNVLVTTAGRCKLTDAGLAGWLLECQDGDGGGEVESSVYVPVNATKDERLSCAVDVYALGVVLLEILTTRKDFVAQKPPPPPPPAETTKAAATSPDRLSPSSSSSAQDWQAWETASNASRSSAGTRLSTARLRFGPYVEKLSGRPELLHAVNALLQPTRPRIDAARRILGKLTAAESYLASKSTLRTDVTYLADELRQLREAVVDGQERSSAAGALLQEFVEQQGAVALETAEMAKGTLYNIERARHEAREQNGMLGNTFVERLDNIYAAAHATYTAVCGSLQHYEAEVRSAANERQTPYGHDRGGPADGHHRHGHMDAPQSGHEYGAAARHQHHPHDMHGVNADGGRNGAAPNGSFQQIASAAAHAEPVHAGVPYRDGWGPHAAAAAAPPPGVCRAPSDAVSPASDRSAGADGLYIEDEWLGDDDKIGRDHLPSGPRTAATAELPESGWNEAGGAESANNAEPDWNGDAASPEVTDSDQWHENAAVTNLAEPGCDDGASVPDGNSASAELEDSGWGESYDTDVQSPEQDPAQCPEHRHPASDVPVHVDGSGHDTSAAIGDSPDSQDSTHRGDAGRPTGELLVHATSLESENTPLVGRRAHPAPATSPSPSEGHSPLQQLSDSADSLADSADSLDGLADYIVRHQELQTASIRDILASHLDTIRSMHQDQVRQLVAMSNEQRGLETSPPAETSPADADDPRTVLNQEGCCSTDTDTESDGGAVCRESGTKGGKDDAANRFGALLNSAYFAWHYVSQVLEIS